MTPHLHTTYKNLGLETKADVLVEGQSPSTSRSNGETQPRTLSLDGEGLGLPRVLSL